MKNNKKIPKYKVGGLQGSLFNMSSKDRSNIKDFMGNGTNAVADITLSALGADNIIKDDAYKGNSAKFFKGYSDVVGGVAKAALPMAANAIVPGSGQFVSMGQNAIGQFNPQDNSMITYDAQGNPIYPQQRSTKQIGQMAGQLGTMGSSFLQFGGMKYPNGGMNMLPNSEVEKQENTLNPDGTTTQFNGSSHLDGGIKTNLNPGTMIFSDELKLGNKTFAELNKSNMTSKEDKILESNKYGNISKHTAELMKFAKNKNSKMLFSTQEALKQFKLQAYAKKMGIKLPSMDNEHMEHQNQSEQSESEFAMGGIQLPMYTNKQNELPKFDGGGKYINGIWIDNTPMIPTKNTQIINPSNSLNYSNSYAPGVMGYNDSMNTPNNPYINPVDNLELKGNPQITEPIQFNNPYIKQKSNIDWNNIGTNVAMGLANNAGNIYNLSRYNNPEIEKYDRLKATYLDPSASLRDADAQTKRAEYNVRGASGGNAGTYLSNRVALNAQNTINKDRINKEYQNINAGISNNVNQYNNQLSQQEIIANAQNRARNRSGKGEAIGSMGSNIANQIMDNKKGSMDQETLNLMIKYYNNPEFQNIWKNLVLIKRKLVNNFVNQ